MSATNPRFEAFQSEYLRGLESLKQNNDAEALACFNRAGQIAPEGWLLVGRNLLKDGHAEFALSRFQEVLRLTKNSVMRADALNNIGMIAMQKGDSSGAFKMFERAHREAPHIPDSLANMGLIAKWQLRFDDAIRYCNRALTLDPWHEQAQFTRSMAKLVSGNYTEGWQEYECRWRSKTNGLAKIPANVPEWDGTNGKKLYVYGEQGHGDSILLLRYSKLIRERGLRQAWVAQRSLTSLARTIPEIDEVVEVDAAWPDFDCHIPSASLPRIFGTTLENIPASPYISKPREPGSHSGFHVGIAWRGSSGQVNDPFRSTNLADWLPVLNVDGVTFHSLQVDNADEGLLYPQLLHHPPPADWLATASRVCGLDLVITVDTALVHLCGALGVPCWVAMHNHPYFVYPPSYGEKTPWYSSVRLFWQKRELEWKPVFERIADELKCKIQS